jgi:DNA-binding response OmpR family regulator
VENKSILVIDDNKEFLAFVLDFLILDMNVGEVIWAITPEEAEEKVLLYNPGIVILDLGMRQLNGQEISSLINNRPDSPIILMTSFYDNEDYINLSKELGADGFNIKDRVKESLVELLNYLDTDRGNLFKDKQYLLN